MERFLYKYDTGNRSPRTHLQPADVLREIAQGTSGNFIQTRASVGNKVGSRRLRKMAERRLGMCGRSNSRRALYALVMGVGGYAPTSLDVAHR